MTVFQAPVPPSLGYRVDMLIDQLRLKLGMAGLMDNYVWQGALRDFGWAVWEMPKPDRQRGTGLLGGYDNSIRRSFLDLAAFRRLVKPPYRTAIDQPQLGIYYNGLGWDLNLGQILGVGRGAARTS